MVRFFIRFAVGLLLTVHASAGHAGDAGPVTVVLADSSTAAAATYFFVPRAVATDPQHVASSEVTQMVVVDFGGHEVDHKIIAERFANEPGGGDFHMALDLPGGIIAIDLHDPNAVTADQLKKNGNHQNMVLMAAYQYKDRGKALYARYYADLDAMHASKVLAGKVIGEIDASGKFKPM